MAFTEWIYATSNVHHQSGPLHLSPKTSVTLKQAQGQTPLTSAKVVVANMEDSLRRVLIHGKWYEGYPKDALGELMRDKELKS